MSRLLDTRHGFGGLAWPDTWPDPGLPPLDPSSSTHFQINQLQLSACSAEIFSEGNARALALGTPDGAQRIPGGACLSGMIPI